jgi:hypothetical protein
VDYEDDKSILQAVDPLWWLKHKSCKYMLTCLVHKDNLDLSTKPAAGGTGTPLYVEHIHQSTDTMEADSIVVACNLTELIDILWNRNIIVLHFHKRIKKAKEKQTNYRH